MNSKHNRNVELILTKMEPAESMPEFKVVWDRFVEKGGIPKAKSVFEWKSLMYKLIPAPVLALAIALIVILQPFNPKPFTTEGEWFNHTDRYVKVNWKGHEAAISPGGHIKMSFVNKSNRSVRIVLMSGKILCHPQRLNSDESFVVVLSDAEVSVLGTVFSVLVDNDLRRVSVAEGKVWIRWNDDAKTNILKEAQTLEWSVRHKGIHRTMDGEDLSDLFSEMKAIKTSIKKWSIGLLNTEAISVAYNENDTLWFTEGPILWKLNGASGASKALRLTNGKILSRPSVYGNKVAVGTSEGGIWIIRSSGKRSGSIPDSPAFRNLAAPELYGKYLVYPTLDANLWIYDTDFQRHDTVEAPEGDTIFGSPIIDPDHGTMYFSTGSGNLYVYDLKQRKVTGKTSVFKERIVFPVLRSGNRLVLTDRKEGRIALISMDNIQSNVVLSNPEFSKIDHQPAVILDRIFWYDPANGKGKLFVIDGNDKYPSCVLFNEFNDKITGISGCIDKIAVSTANGRIYFCNKSGKIIDGVRLTGKVVGSDKNGIYILNEKYLNYYSYDIIL